MKSRGIAQGRAPCAPRAVQSKRLPGRNVDVSVRAEGGNVFQKLGTQLTKVGNQVAGTVKTLTGTARVGRKNQVDTDVVFVAGATGRLGARVVKQCLEAGFTVRAGVRSREKGEKLIATAKEYGWLSPQEEKRINLIEYDLFDESSIAPALANAGLVVCAIGASETQIFNTSAPKKVDGDAAIALVKAAKANGVKRFVMVTSLGTTKFGWPASVLNLWWGVLYWKKLAEEALIKSGMEYTIIRPGGMEKPTDAFKETHNLVLQPRDTLFGGVVSRLQVAELAAAVLKNPELSGNKTLEVIASDEVELQGWEALLSGVEPDITVEEMLERQSAIADARNAAEALSAEAEELEADLAEKEERKVLAEKRFAEARGQLQELRNENLGKLRGADDASATVERLSEQLEDARRQEAAAKAVLDAQRRAARSSELLSQADIKEITQPIMNPQSAAEGAAGKAASAGGGLLGGLFGQAKQAGAEVEEAAEEVVEPPKAAAKRAGGGLGGLFGGKAKQEAPVEEEKEEAAPASAAKEQKPAQTSKGGGLFGFFQQDTVYADDAEGDASAAPSSEQVERAVTKKGRPARKSVRDLVPKKDSEEQSEASASAQPAAPKKQPAAPKSNPLGGLFGGVAEAGRALSEGASDAADMIPAKPSDDVPTKAESKAPAKPKAPAPKPAKADKPDEALSEAGQKAVSAALGGLNAAGKAAEDVQDGAEAAAKETKKSGVATLERPKTSDIKPESTNGAVVDNAKEARQWIEQWRAKQ